MHLLSQKLSLTILNYRLNKPVEVMVSCVHITCTAPCWTTVPLWYWKWNSPTWNYPQPVPYVRDSEALHDADAACPNSKAVWKCVSVDALVQRSCCNHSEHGECGEVEGEGGGADRFYCKLSPGFIGITVGRARACARVPARARGRVCVCVSFSYGFKKR